MSEPTREQIEAAVETYWHVRRQPHWRSNISSTTQEEIRDALVAVLREALQSHSSAMQEVK